MSVITGTPGLINAIRNGDLDEQLPALAVALAQRQRVLRADKQRQLRPGDTVHFSNAIHPRYLIGLPVTVLRVNEQSVTVECPDEPQYRKYAGASGVRCPTHMIAELI